MKTKKWHLSGREAASHCNGAIFHEISKDTISKIKYTALFSNLMKPSLKSSSAIYDYVKVQQLDDICQIPAIKSKQDGKIRLKSCFRGG
jgi:hypothetical protein